MKTLKVGRYTVIEEKDELGGTFTGVYEPTSKNFTEHACVRLIHGVYMGELSTKRPPQHVRDMPIGKERMEANKEWCEYVCDMSRFIANLALRGEGDKFDKAGLTSIRASEEKGQ